LKVQVVQLPNGMIGSVFMASLHNSDSGMLNLSGLNFYLASLLQARGLLLEDGNVFPGLYGDGIFPALSCIIARLGTPQIE
jgi:hypothetical protein